MVAFDKMPPSRQPEGTFPWMQQQPPKPLFPAFRPITAKENLLRIYKGEKPCWMPIWLTDSQYCWPDVYQEHAVFEGTGGVQWLLPQSRRRLPGSSVYVPDNPPHG